MVLILFGNLARSLKFEVISRIKNWASFFREHDTRELFVAKHVTAATVMETYASGLYYTY